MEHDDEHVTGYLEKVQKKMGSADATTSSAKVQTAKVENEPILFFFLFPSLSPWREGEKNVRR